MVVMIVSPVIGQEAGRGLRSPTKATIRDSTDAGLTGWIALAALDRYFKVLAYG